jgi:hypothetical protein
MAAIAGQIAKDIGIEIVSRNAASAITMGDVVGFDANGNARTASITNTISNIANGFGVAIEDGTASSNVRVAVGNTYVYVTCGVGPIDPYALVAPTTSASIVGRVIENTFAATATNSVTLLGGLVGRYMGHEGEEDNQTDATTGEVIIVRLGL